MRTLTLLGGTLLIALSPLAFAQEEEPVFTDEFPLEDCDFKSRGGNPFFDLTPGRQSYFSNQEWPPANATSWRSCGSRF